MSSVPWSSGFEAAIRAQLPDSLPPGSVSPDLQLFAAGLNSVAMIGLVADLEERFAFTFPEELLIMETFATPDSLWEAIAASLNQTESELA